jgi:hypothetical protein
MAAYVIRDLLDHDLPRTPEDIAADAPADGPPDADSVRVALTELRDRGLAEETPDGWRATDAARAG